MGYFLLILFAALFLIIEIRIFTEWAGKKWFPCSSYGPMFHLTEPENPDAVIMGIGYKIRCTKCGERWEMTRQHYSIASDGDSSSFIAEWSRIGNVASQQLSNQQLYECQCGWHMKCERNIQPKFCPKCGNKLGQVIAVVGLTEEEFERTYPLGK